MSDDKTTEPPDGLVPESVRIQDIYRFVSTRLNEALLELDSLVILGQLLHNEPECFVDREAVEGLLDVVNRVDKNRLQHQHGIPSDADNVLFLEQHPYFFPRDEEDEEDE